MFDVEVSSFWTQLNNLLYFYFIFSCNYIYLKNASSQNQLFNLLEFVFLCVTDTVSFTASLWPVRAVKAKQAGTEDRKPEDGNCFREPKSKFISSITLSLYLQTLFI